MTHAPPTPPPDVLLQSLQAMAPALAHELRNPLSGILAGSQMLARLLPAQGPAGEYAAIVRDEAQRLERLLARLSEFGRLRADGLALQAELSVNELVEGVARDPRAVPDGRWRLACQLAPGLPALAGDPLRLRAALCELLQNACQAMPDGGCLTVATRLAGAPPRVEVEVADAGPGFDPEAQARALEPFFSTRPRALGVGLCLASLILQAHGGGLRIQSSSAGARVALLLPVTRDA
ncbi:MAG: ATP-binding protein [Candidatus Methylomirabilales bacterium]